MASDFNPNRLSFEEGLDRIRQAAGGDLGTKGRVLTSRDDSAIRARDSLAVDNVPAGFVKWQLPVYLSAPSQLFVTVAEPGAKARAHSHDEGDGIRFIAGGSIIFEGTELVPGDWMFIPGGTHYDFEVGPNGAIMCYCYSCCCA
ncbi:MAG: cupin domain-containing protein [Acidimicrobiales bacterium]